MKTVAKADLKTICNAVVEGAMSLGGCTVFFGNMFDLVANKITTFEPDFMGISRWGFLASMPFSVIAGYGAYKCHHEIGKANQPQTFIAANETIRTVEETLLDNNKPSEPNALQTKTKEELIDMISELRCIIETQNEKLHTEEKEIADAKSIPLTWKQRIGIAGEYIAHSAGFTGDMLAFIRLGIGVSFEVELGLQIACLIVGYISAMSEARTAEENMRINNLREKLSKHHGFFKQQHNDIHITISSANTATTENQTPNSPEYHAF